MFKKCKEFLKKIFIYIFICLILISSPIVQDITIYNNIVTRNSIVLFEEVNRGQTLLLYNIPLEQININMTNMSYQISKLQQQGYGFIQIIFIILAWIIRIIIFIIKLIIRLIITIFMYLRVFLMYFLRSLPNFIRIITIGIRKLSILIVKGAKLFWGFIKNIARNLIPLLKKGMNLLTKATKNIFKYIKKGILLLKNFILKIFNKIKQSIGKISTSKKVATSGTLGTVTSKQILANTDTKVIPSKTKSTGKVSTAKIKSIKPGKQNTNLKYNRNLSPNVKNYISNSNEKNIYNTLGLKETKINNRRILRRENIYDINKKDEEGRTNLERMKQGLAPLDNNNHSIELHHIGQKMDSPLAELKYDEHKKYFGDIHSNFKESEIDRVKFAKEKREYWKKLAEIYEESLGK
mgnify:CR=1 FL=1